MPPLLSLWVSEVWEDGRARPYLGGKGRSSQGGSSYSPPPHTMFLDLDVIGATLVSMTLVI